MHQTLKELGEQRKGRIHSANALEILSDEVMLEPRVVCQVIRTVNVILGWGKLSANSRIHKRGVFKELQRSEVSQEK